MASEEPPRRTASRQQTRKMQEDKMSKLLEDLMIKLDECDLQGEMGDAWHNFLDGILNPAAGKYNFVFEAGNFLMQPRTTQKNLMLACRILVSLCKLKPDITPNMLCKNFTSIIGRLKSKLIQYSNDDSNDVENWLSMLQLLGELLGAVLQFRLDEKLLQIGLSCLDGIGDRVDEVFRFIIRMYQCCAKDQRQKDLFIVCCLQHPKGKLLSEMILQNINEISAQADHLHVLHCLDLMTGCLKAAISWDSYKKKEKKPNPRTSMQASQNRLDKIIDKASKKMLFTYTSDSWVLLEILAREWQLTVWIRDGEVKQKVFGAFLECTATVLEYIYLKNMRHWHGALSTEHEIMIALDWAKDSSGCWMTEAQKTKCQSLNELYFRQLAVKQDPALTGDEQWYKAQRLNMEREQCAMEAADRQSREARHTKRPRESGRSTTSKKSRRQVWDRSPQTRESRILKPLNTGDVSGNSRATP